MCVYVCACVCVCMHSPANLWNELVSMCDIVKHLMRSNGRIKITPKHLQNATNKKGEHTSTVNYGSNCTPCNEICTQSVMYQTTVLIN